MVLALVVAALGALALSARALHARNRRREARALYEAQLERALADGILSPDEAAELGAFRSSGDLTEAEARMVALTLYRRALRDAAEDARFTDEEEERLRTLHHQLDLSAEDLAGDRDQLHRLWLLAQVERGRLPRVEAPFELGHDELCHWVVRATSCGRSGLPSSRAEPAGLRFNVGGKAPFQAVGERDALEDDPRILPMDVGSIAVTDRRLVFRGARRRFALPHVVLQAVTLYRDGLRLIIERGAPIHLLVEDPELTAAILLRVAGERRRAVGDASPAHTA